MILQASLDELRTKLSAREVTQIERNARIADEVESHWKTKLGFVFAMLIDHILDSVVIEDGEATYAIPDDLEHQLAVFFLEHELSTVIAAEGTIAQPDYIRAAKKPKTPRWPSNAARIRDMWDSFRRTGKVPGIAAVHARKIKKIFIKKVQKIFRENADDFIKGDSKPGYQNNPNAWNREEAKRAMERELKVAKARADMIVETETTRYYNDTRVDIYSNVNSVVGFLFVCIRDARTTPWCISRGGAVFTAGSPLLKKNTPPCHWNCRSELLPLSRLNPAHQKLLNDPRLRAENRAFVPLPEGWNELP